MQVLGINLKNYRASKRGYFTTQCNDIDYFHVCQQVLAISRIYFSECFLPLPYYEVRIIYNTIGSTMKASQTMVNPSKPKGLRSSRNGFLKKFRMYLITTSSRPDS